jgi:hypothetical protein
MLIFLLEENSQSSPNEVPSQKYMSMVEDGNYPSEIFLIPLKVYNFCLEQKFAELAPEFVSVLN